MKELRKKKIQKKQKQKESKLAPEFVDERMKKFEVIQRRNRKRELEEQEARAKRLHDLRNLNGGEDSRYEFLSGDESTLTQDKTTSARALYKKRKLEQDYGIKNPDDVMLESGEVDMQRVFSQMEERRTR